jgi:hypothetical protein
MKKKVFYLIIIIFIISLPIFFTEMYLKSIGLGDPIVYDENYVYGYAPRPNQKKKRLKNSSVTINDVGLRSLKNWGPNKHKKKIIFFGDSVTYGGSYIDDKEIFSHLTCVKINLPDFICGNAGVNAYGIFNIVYRSKYDQRIADEYIRVFLLVPDDFYRGLQNKNTAHFYLNEKKKFLPAISEALNFIATKYNIKNSISKYSDNYREENKYDLIKESVEIFNLEMIRLQLLNKRFIIFYTPSKGDHTLNNYIYNELNENINFEIIDLSKHISDNLLEDSVHYNKKGHETVSDIISEKILSLLK